ncbi:MAG TPA: membrane dipeptidase [Armatimonadota bacterium]|jgi:membrane dipeptidase
MGYIIDGHIDLAWNAVDLERDETAALEDIRAKEGATPAHGEGVATVSLPALRAAGVRLLLGTVFTEPYREGGKRPGYRSAEEAYQRARAQFAYYHDLHAAGQISLIQTQDELAALLAGATPIPGLVPLLEGADSIRDPSDLAQFVAWGLRIVGLSWHGTRYAGGTKAPGPLTDAGRALLAEMTRLGVALDVSHLAEESFWQALEIFPGRVIASHANCRALVPGDRQLSDEMIRAVAARDGVIGVVLYNPFLRAGWTPEIGKAGVTLQDVLAHIDHLVGLVGVEHVGIGSDLDGGVGRDDIPRELDAVTDLPRIADTLAAAGYPDAHITAIMASNWLRVLRNVLP